MNRRRFIKAAGIGAATAAGAAAPAIAKRVAELKDNRFQIRVFATREIVPGLQALDAVQANTVECAHTESYYHVRKDPTFAFDAAEWVGPYDDEKLGFNKVAKYYYYPG